MCTICIDSFEEDDIIRKLPCTCWCDTNANTNTFIYYRVCPLMRMLIRLFTVWKFLRTESDSAPFCPECSPFVVHCFRMHGKLIMWAAALTATSTTVTALILGLWKTAPAQRASTHLSRRLPMPVSTPRNRTLAKRVLVTCAFACLLDSEGAEKTTSYASLSLTEIQKKSCLTPKRWKLSGCGIDRLLQLSFAGGFF